MSAGLTTRERGIEPYLTIVEDRAPRKKVHLGIGEAKKAVLYKVIRDRVHTDCKIYFWDDEQGWTLKWDIPEGTPREELPWL